MIRKVSGRGIGCANVRNTWMCERSVSKYDVMKVFSGGKNYETNNVSGVGLDNNVDVGISISKHS